MTRGDPAGPVGAPGSGGEVRRGAGFVATVPATAVLVATVAVAAVWASAGWAPDASAHAVAEGAHTAPGAQVMPGVQGAPGYARVCQGPEVLLVHDLAGTGADWDQLSADLRAAGWCPVSHSWGEPRPGDVPLPVGGLTGVEAAAAELVRERGWDRPAAAGDRPDAAAPDRAVPGAPVPVVARGVGGLVVQRALQMSADGPPPMSTLITLGPVWNGTNVLGIADVEDLSRELGTFEALLAWERTWMDPLCEGCREAVRGSETLTTLHREGIRTPGVAYTDIVTATDLLVHPPLEQSPPGTRVEVVPPPAAGPPVWHGELGRDVASRTLVIGALDAT